MKAVVGVSALGAGGRRHRSWNLSLPPADRSAVPAGHDLRFRDVLSAGIDVMYAREPKPVTDVGATQQDERFLRLLRQAERR